MNFPLQIFFKDFNHGYKAALLKKNSSWLLSVYIDVDSYCYYKKRRSLRISSIFYSFSASELNNIESQSQNNVFAHEFS